MIAWQVGQTTQPIPDPQILSRWVHLLTSAIPPDFNDALLEGIAENCTAQGLLVNLLQIDDTMTASRRQTDPRFARNNSDLDDHQIQTLWDQCLKPNLPEIAEPLLERTVQRLEERHSLIRAWEGEQILESDSFSRSAIEPHEQDKYHEGVDVLINIARDCLEWMATNQPDAVTLWSERYSRSQAPLLRRLAVHNLPVRIDVSADEKIVWLQERYDVNELPAKHEIFRAVARIYPDASLEQRKSVIDSVLSFRWPREDHPDRDLLTAHHKFDWFQWLNKAAPDCPLAKQAAETILISYPGLVPSEHPDMTIWTQTWQGSGSPWTAEELLGKPAKEWLAALLEYQPTHPFQSVNRDGLLVTVMGAAEKNFSWGLELANEMANLGRPDADLWPRLFRAWSTADLGQDNIRQVLAHLSDDKLYRHHVRELTDVIYELVKKVTGPETLDLLAQANAIAKDLHHYAVKVSPPRMTQYIGGVAEEVDWYTKTISHPSGRLAQFWIQSIALWRQQKNPPPSTPSAEYQDALAKIMADQEPSGKLARVILAAHISFLAYADEEWTRRNLMPLLDYGHDEFDSAWDGITHPPNANSTAEEILKEPFLQAVEHIKERMAPEARGRFIARYTSMLTLFVSTPTDQWITKLIAGGDQETRRQFTREIGHRLRFLNEPTQKEWWNTWLRGYWENRLTGIPAQLDPEEIEAMIYWTANLTAVYPEAVELAVRMPAVPMRVGTLIHRSTDSNIPAKHPGALAKLLIRLRETDAPNYMWYGTRSIMDQLLQTPLDEETNKGLKEIVAKFALQPCQTDNTPRIGFM